MKKLVIASAIAMCGLVSAQKNTLLVGGNVAYTSTTSKMDGTTKGENKKFEFNPTIGYQFTDNLTAGVRFGVGSDKTTGYATLGNTTYNIEDKTNSFSYGVFGRYAMPLSDTFAVYGDLDLGLTNGKTTVSNSLTSTSTTAKSNGMYVGFTPALFINFKNSFGLNFSIGGIKYTTDKVDGSNAKTNTFDINFGKTINIGISKNFKL